MGFLLSTNIITYPLVSLSALRIACTICSLSLAEKNSFGLYKKENIPTIKN